MFWTTAISMARNGRPNIWRFLRPTYGSGRSNFRKSQSKQGRSKLPRSWEWNRNICVLKSRDFSPQRIPISRSWQISWCRIHMCWYWKLAVYMYFRELQIKFLGTPIKYSRNSNQSLWELQPSPAETSQSSPVQPQCFGLHDQQIKIRNLMCCSPYNS